MTGNLTSSYHMASNSNLQRKMASNTHKQFLFNSLTHEEKRRSIITKMDYAADPAPVRLSHKWVKKNKLLKEHRDFVKIKINPIGWNNLCYQNSLYTCEYDPDYDLEVGYNITACPCGGLINGEPHFVNSKIVNGKKVYYDFTKDFDGEDHKLFVPSDKIKRKISEEGDDGVTSFLKDRYDFHYGIKRCKCGCRWGDGGYYGDKH
jgi:hypothetical protein